MLKLEITRSLVTELVAEQFPQWAHLLIKPVELSGWDNRTFHLGDEMLVRLPSAACYAEQVKKEHTWLPMLAPRLSLQIPEPLAMGQPSDKYPWHWSIYRWLEGKSANALPAQKLDLTTVASQLAQFLQELHDIDVTGAPAGGEHNFYRGCALTVYDDQTRELLIKLQNYIDTDIACNVWQKALSSAWQHKPVWVHGDVSSGNILVQESQLVAVIDFGCMAVGDPACDLVIAWTFFADESRELFKTRVSLDQDTWARARGWALWKACFELEGFEDKSGSEAVKRKKIIKAVLDEHKGATI